MDIRKKANSLARKHKTRNPLEIVRGLNVIIVHAPLIGVRGFYQYFQRNNIIYIDENLPLHEQALVCAHEMGHMLLHKDTNVIFMDTRTQFNTNKFEMEANYFAMQLLVGDDTILENRNCTLEQLARLLGYQIELIELRMNKN